VRFGTVFSNPVTYSKPGDIVIDVEVQDSISDLVDQVLATLYEVECQQAMPNALLGLTSTSNVCLEGVLVKVLLTKLFLLLQHST